MKKTYLKREGKRKMNLKKVLCAALSTVTAVSLLASCGGKGKNADG